MRRKDKKKKKGFRLFEGGKVETSVEHTKMMESVIASIRDAQEWDIPLDEIFVARLVAQHGANYQVDITQAVKRFKEEEDRPLSLEQGWDGPESFDSCGSSNHC